MALPQVAEPTKQQADSIKSEDTISPALDKQHKQSLLGSAVTHLGKQSKKEFVKGYPYKYSN